MKIIGLGHFSRAGKDSLANYLLLSCKRRKLKAIKMPFAWKLKQICHELYAWAGLREPEYYDTATGEKYRDVNLPALGMTPVEIWVAFGTPAVREKVYDMTWVDYVLKTKHDADVLIIPDVRFPNEVEAIKEAGGFLIKVVRPGVKPKQTVADQALVDYDGWDDVVGKSGKLDELHEYAKKLAASIKAGVI
jgi:hypothetical protein